MKGYSKAVVIAAIAAGCADAQAVADARAIGAQRAMDAIGGLRSFGGTAFAGFGRGRPTPRHARRWNPKHRHQRAMRRRKARAK